MDGMGWGGQNGAPPPAGTPESRQEMPNQGFVQPNTPVDPVAANVGPMPIISVAQWHNGIRMAFMDVMLDPKKGKGA